LFFYLYNFLKITAWQFGTTNFEIHSAFLKCCMLTHSLLGTLANLLLCIYESGSSPSDAAASRFTHRIPTYARFVLEVDINVKI
jgi:hypothetical protein